MKPFRAKGSKVIRCSGCLLAREYCICQFKKNTHAKAEFWLLMHKEEQYKPSNTGRLIEMVLPEHSRRFIWASRTEADPEFLAMLADERYQPYIIFPDNRPGYAERVVDITQVNAQAKIPAFIILDGTWRQASRMFRHSLYLQDLPVLGIQTERESQYGLREAPEEGALCTVEVAIELLRQTHQDHAAHMLDEFFEVFNRHYVAARKWVVIPEAGVEVNNAENTGE
ncbi:MAG: DTW domain-containing protein [Oceanospirillaceae bacterium]|nr:DTW domain-containing protein [Oceanospirillaceae bacterium]